MKSYHIPPVNSDLIPSIQEKIDHLSKSKESLGYVETLALRIALMQETLTPSLSHPCHILFSADHGIVEDGVSLAPQFITYQQTLNFARGGACASVFAKLYGFDFTIVDAGVVGDLSIESTIINRKVAEGTQNYRLRPAMTREQMEYCLQVGEEFVASFKAKGSNVLSVGEMGIGNTSTSSLWMHFLTQIPLPDCVGVGSGLSPQGVRHKVEILTEATLRLDGDPTPERLMQEFGGFELVMAVGAMLAAAERRMLVLVDGFVMGAVALMASRIAPNFLDYVVFGHKSKETGHVKMLAAMNAVPLLDLGMHLGEGIGAMMAYPIVEGAVAMLTQMGTFTSDGITKYFK